MSLDGLPAGHLRVLLDGLSVFEQHGLLLAGGYAFRAHEIVYRPSQDLDFATGNHEPLPEIAAHVRQAFVSAGYGTRVVEATGRCARLVLRLPGSGDELEMDLLKEALGPGGITVQLAPGASVRAVSLDDAVGLKARAWHDRFVIRDIIDLHAIADAFSYADIENLARRHDPDLDLGTFWNTLPVSACSPTKTSLSTAWMTQRSAAFAHGPPAGTTTSPAVWPRTIRTTKRLTTPEDLQYPDSWAAPACPQHLNRGQPPSCSVVPIAQ